MQHVLGTYASLAAAEMAVRALESDGFSIQNVVITDHKQRVWRKLHAQSGADAIHPRQGFVVYTTDDAEMSERARTLLAAQPKRVAAS